MIDAMMNDEQIPELLYHVSPQCVYDSILKDGLKANFGEVYASEQPGHALGFMWFRILDHVHRKLISESNEFEIVAHDHIDIWTIDTSMLAGKNLEHSTDHSAAFFGNATSWVHRGDIPPEALIHHDTISREELMKLTEAI